MEHVSLRNKLLVAAIAAMAAAVMAFGLSVLPTQAYADYAAGTPAYQVTGKIKASKSKIKGKWKLKKASGYNASSTNSHIQILKRFHKKHTITFKKNGNAVEKDWYGVNCRLSSKTKYKWIAVSKTKGYLVSTSGTLNGRVIGTIKVKGKKLTLTARGTSTIKWTFKK